MAIPATQLRPGMVIKHNNDLHSVFSVEHRTPGNLRAFIQAKLRNLRTGAMFEHRFRSGDAIEKITVDEVQMEFLYADGDDYYFMNTENYEQLHLTGHPGRCGRLPHRQSADQGRVLRRQGSGRRTAADGGAHRRRNRAGVEVGNGQQRYQAGQDGNRAGGAGATVHQRGRKDPRGHLGRRVPVAGVGANCQLLSSAPDLETRRYVISGRVQGVGFRWFVEREAAQLGVTGWVRNCENGDVEVMATGNARAAQFAAPEAAAGPASVAR